MRGRTVMAAVGLALASAGAWAQSGGIYTCVDAKGKRWTSDRYIAECSDREQKLMGGTGTVRAVVPPTLTAREREAQEAADKKAAEEAQKRGEEKRVQRALVSRYPNREEGLYYQATVLLLRGRPADAAALARRVVAADPQSAKAQNLLGAACASTGQRDCAETAFAASIRLNPREPSSYVNIGLFYLQTARPEHAADSFGEALSLDPSSAAAKDGLRQARAALPSQ